MLIGMLARAEGVSTATTEELFIHYHATDGQVLEVLGHDRKTGLLVMDYTKEPRPAAVPTNSGKSDKPKNKPHLRLIAAKPDTTTPKHPVHTGANGLYHAHMATR